MPQPIRLALVNDYEVVIRGLEEVLHPFADRVHVVQLNANTRVDEPVDIALYDTFSVTQVDKSDIDELVANPLVGQVAVYTWNMHRDLITIARGKGILGYLSKSLTAAELVPALERIAQGEVVIAPDTDIDRNPTEIDINDADWPGRAHGLTARQAEIVALVTAGLSNAEIAERTYLTMNTVKSYIRIAYRRMGVSSRSQAVLWGVEHGMLPQHRQIDR